MGTSRERSWYVSLHVTASGRQFARFGHRKAGAGWVWDELEWDRLGDATTEASILNELYGAVCEFLERRVE